MRVIKLSASGVNLFFSCVVSCVLFFTGCSFVDSMLGGEAAQNAALVDARSANIDSIKTANAPEKTAQRAPINLEVMQAQIGGNNSLEIVADVEALTKLDTNRVAIVASGFSNSTLKQEQIQKLSDISPKQEMQKGDKVLARFTLDDAQGITDYQVKASWGADADAILAKQSSDMQKEDDALRTQLDSHITDTPLEEKQPETKGEGVPAVSISIESTEKSPVNCVDNVCDTLLSLNTLITNNASSKINSVTLGVGLFWANDGQIPEFPKYGDVAADSEELVSLSELFIASGESRFVRIKIDRPFPNVPGGAFVPHVRLINFVKE